MSHDIIMPVLGMNQDTGIIAEWLKAPGDWVASGDVVMSVETDKAVQDIESRYEGYLSHVKYDAGAEVPVGDVIAQLTAEPESARAVTDEKVPVDQKNVAPVATVVEAPASESKITQPLEKKISTSVGGKVLASPKAKALLKERGIAISELVDDGIAQPIHAADVTSFERKVSKVTTASCLGKINSTVNPEAILETECWLAADGMQISRAELFSLLVVGTLRYTKVIAADADCSVVIPSDESCLLNPDLFGLADLQKSDEENGFVCLWDFTESTISGFELDSDAKLNVSVFGGEQWTLELRFDTQTINPKQAVTLLSELTRRITQPLRQLL
jgi:hypothetical protein